MVKFWERHKARKQLNAARIEFDRANAHLTYLEGKDEETELCSGWGLPLISEEEQLSKARERLEKAEQLLEEAENKFKNL